MDKMEKFRVNGNRYFNLNLPLSSAFHLLKIYRDY